MQLLTKDYFTRNKWLALTGAIFGAVMAAMIARWPLGFLASPIAWALLSFPYTAKTISERVLRWVLIGFYVNLVLVYGGRVFLPLAWTGFLGSIVFGAVIFCPRYRPPVAEGS